MEAADSTRSFLRDVKRIVIKVTNSVTFYFILFYFHSSRFWSHFDFLVVDFVDFVWCCFIIRITLFLCVYCNQINRFLQQMRLVRFCVYFASSWSHWSEDAIALHAPIVTCSLYELVLCFQHSLVSMVYKIKWHRSRRFWMKLLTPFVWLFGLLFSVSSIFYIDYFFHGVRMLGKEKWVW